MTLKINTDQNPASIPTASASEEGLMSAADKTKLDGIVSYAASGSFIMGLSGEFDVAVDIGIPPNVVPNIIWMNGTVLYAASDTTRDWISYNLNGDREYSASQGGTFGPGGLTVNVAHGVGNVQVVLSDDVGIGGSSLIFRFIGDVGVLYYYSLAFSKLIVTNP